MEIHSIILFFVYFMENDLVTPCVSGQENEKLDFSKTLSEVENINEKSPVEMVLAAFWALYNQEESRLTPFLT